MKVSWLKQKRLLPFMVLVLGITFFLISQGDAETALVSQAPSQQVSQSITDNPTKPTQQELSQPISSDKSTSTTKDAAAPLAATSTQGTTSGKSQKAEFKRSRTPNFDHNKTGFPLDGAHKTTRCELCHIKGSFKNTPKDCYSCHGPASNIGAVQMPNNHIAVTRRCEACHITVNFYAITQVDHKEVLGACSSCHDGITANTKGPNHPPTTGECSLCHFNTYQWMASAFNHQGITNNCVRCHNGVQASGKPSWHPVVTIDCSNCHNTVNWNTAAYDHTGITNNCGNCHNGVFAHGKANTHMATSNTCELCHTPGALGTVSLGNGQTASGEPQMSGWLTPIIPLPHTNGAVVGSCVSCHSSTGNKTIDSYAVEGVVSGTHIPLTGTDCSKCHVTTAWNPYTAPMDHSQVSLICTTCHNSSGGDKTTYSNVTIDGVNGAQGTHMPILSSADCTKCHTTAAWNPYKTSPMDHTYVSGTCASCHSASNSFTNLTPTNTYLDSETGGPNFPTTGFTHPTTALDCSSCHTTTTTWKTSNYNHTGVTTGCYGCHNGGNGTAKGKGPSHMALASNVCEDCHTTGTLDVNGNPSSTAPGGWYTPLLPIKHSDFATQTPCTGCHANGKDTTIDGYTVHGAGGALGKHIPLITSVDCAKCHSVTGATWVNSMTNALPVMDHSQVTTSCVTCHLSTGDNAAYPNISPAIDGAGVGHLGTHIALTGTDCTKCHGYSASGWGTASLVNSLPVMDHTLVSSSCASCHSQSGDTTVTNSVGNLTVDGIGGNVAGPHIALIAGSKCELCHSYSASGWVSSLKVAMPSMDHTDVSGVCSSCHAPAAAYANISVMDSKTTGQGAQITHPVTTAECSTCHKVTTSWQTVNYDHTGIVNGCNSCHTGGLAKGPSSTHWAQNGHCESCHYPTAIPSLDANGNPPTNGWSIRPTTILHSAFTLTTCTSCHLASGNSTVDGITVEGVVTGTHIPLTGTDCTKCHNNTAATFGTASLSVALPQMDHSQVSQTNCVLCHLSTGDNASFASLTVDGAGTGHLGTHIALTGTTCTACHQYSSSGWGTSSLINTLPAMDHAQVSGTCATCHKSTGDTTVTNTVGNLTVDGIGGHISGPHIGYLTSGDCNLCHIYTTASWTASMKQALPAMDHTSVGATCSSCHGGSSTAYPNVTVDTKSAGPNVTSGFNHVSTAQECSVCHKTPSGTGTTGGNWANAVYTHALTDTNCISCHVPGNTVGADYVGHSAAYPSATHIPLTGTNCAVCHTQTGNWALAPASPMDHTQVDTSSSGCALCHTGQTFTNITMEYVNSSNAGIYGGKAITHIPLSATTCGDCHITSSTTWAYSGTNASFHTTHPSDANMSLSCATCHSTTGSSTYAGASAMPIDTYATAAGKAYTHFPLASGASAACGDCHVTTSGSWAIASRAAFVHGDATAPTTCTTCHSTTQTYGTLTANLVDTTAYYNGTTQTHMSVLTSVQCSACHTVNYTNWMTGLTVVGFNHNDLTTPATCTTCHVTGATFTGGMAIDTQTSLQGSAVTHITTSGGQCGDCHSFSQPWTYVAMPMSHTDVSSSCTNCHNQGSPLTWTNLAVDSTTCETGSLASGGGSIGPTCANTFTHPPGVAPGQCNSCHSKDGTTDWLNATSSVDHSTFTCCKASSTNCESCHTPGNTTSAIGRSGSHIPIITATGNCTYCHNVGVASPPSTGSAWTVTAPMNHTQVSTTCTTASCHQFNTTSHTVDGTNGSTAVTVPDSNYAGTHYPTTTNCSACHLSTDTSFATDHGWIHSDGTTSITSATAQGTLCNTCHLQGTYGKLGGSLKQNDSGHHSGQNCTAANCHGTCTQTGGNNNCGGNVSGASMTTPVTSTPKWGN